MAYTPGLPKPRRDMWQNATPGDAKHSLASSPIPKLPGTAGTAGTCPAGVQVEPALNPRPVYYRSADGRAHRGMCTWLGRTADPDGSARFWVGVEHAGGFTWVHESALISKQTYDTQAAPIKPGWQIVYRRNTNLQDAIVRSATHTPSGWVFATEDGTAIHESAVVSVAEIRDGRVVAAWTVKEHGLAGEGARQREGKQDELAVRGERVPRAACPAAPFWIGI